MKHSYFSVLLAALLALPVFATAQNSSRLVLDFPSGSLENMGDDLTITFVEGDNGGLAYEVTNEAGETVLTEPVTGRLPTVQVGDTIEVQAEPSPNNRTVRYTVTSDSLSTADMASAFQQTRTASARATGPNSSGMARASTGSNSEMSSGASGVGPDTGGRAASSLINYSPFLPNRSVPSVKPWFSMPQKQSWRTEAYNKVFAARRAAVEKRSNAILYAQNRISNDPDQLLRDLNIRIDKLTQSERSELVEELQDAGVTDPEVISVVSPDTSNPQQ